MKKFILILLLIILVLYPVLAENRTALFIGNGTYFHFTKLAKPKAEAIYIFPQFFHDKDEVISPNLTSRMLYSFIWQFNNSFIKIYRIRVYK